MDQPSAASLHMCPGPLSPSPLPLAEDEMLDETSYWVTTVLRAVLAQVLAKEMTFLTIHSEHFIYYLFQKSLWKILNIYRCRENNKMNTHLPTHHFHNFQLTANLDSSPSLPTPPLHKIILKQHPRYRIISLHA